MDLIFGGLERVGGVVVILELLLWRVEGVLALGWRLRVGIGVIVGVR